MNDKNPDKKDEGAKRAFSTDTAENERAEKTEEAQRAYSEHTAATDKQKGTGHALNEKTRDTSNDDAGDKASKGEAFSKETREK